MPFRSVSRRRPAIATDVLEKTRDRIASDDHINRREQLADKLQRCAFLTQFQDAFFQRHQFCVTHERRPREYTSGLVEALGAHCVIGRLTHTMRARYRRARIALAVLRGKASLPKILGFIHRSSLTGKAVTGSTIGARLVV
jgi:hypothetical protein